MQASDDVIDPAFIEDLVDEIALSVSGDAPAVARRRRMAHAALLAARPADAMAAVLIAQALTAHYAAMDAYRKASQAEDDKLATRLRSNAAGLARMMRICLKDAEARREPADGARPRRAARAAKSAQTAAAPVAAPLAASQASPPTREEMTVQAHPAAFGYVQEGEQASASP